MVEIVGGGPRGCVPEGSGSRRCASTSRLRRVVMRPKIHALLTWHRVPASQACGRPAHTCDAHHAGQPSEARSLGSDH